MARTRSIKPGFFTNDLLAEVEPLGRLLFAGLWTVADRAGRVLDRPRKLKAELLPYDDCDVDGLLDHLARLGFIDRYVVDGRAVIAVVNWAKHQQPHINEKPSDLPAPILVGESSSIVRRPVPEQHHASTVQVPEQHGSTQPGTRYPEPGTRNPVPGNAAAAATRGCAREAAAAAASAANVPESVKTLHASLAGAPGYEPSPAFLEKVAAKYGHLDLEEEAIKMLGWLRNQPKAKRRCSTAFVLNWLDRTAQGHASAQPRAPNGRARPGLRGPGGRQELTTAQLIVDSRQHDIACDANEELPPELRAEVEHLEAIGWRLSAGP